MRALILSDIHLGNGSSYEIYAGGDALPALIDAEAGPDLHIILNGDAVDFLLDDAPLRLDLDQALATARATAAHPPTAAVFQALRRLLAVGGSVTIRLGNHDIELAIPEVQAIFREALGQPDEVGARLIWALGQEPGVVEAGGARVIYTHGEHCDPWNRVDYKELLDRAAWGTFKHPPGSRLVKNMLNPLKKDFGLRFADLLKPDFHGAVMAALAVDPSSVKAVNPGEAATLAARVFKRSFEANTFADGEVDELAPIEDMAADAELTQDEEEALAALMDDAPTSFGDPDTERSAKRKLLKGALKLYAGLHRTVASKEGDAYFSLEPSADEWKESARLAKKYGVSAVIFGHTHAARWGERDGLLFANTGTWIGLMQLPASEASDEVWASFLDRLQRNPGLDPAVGPSVPVLTRFTGVEIAAHPDGGARVALIEWQNGDRVILGETRVRG